MNSFQENHSEDFKALALHLVATSDIQTVAAQTGLPVSTLYDWQDDWNKKKNPAYKTDGVKPEDQNRV
ncbi:helix-turn-helix domain-containing protein [Spirosoma utsteinense]|uniref:Transposase-like protein n=1 Tax=Spirosoma utsteinense TaxID=2585773 RepID=A0ABR6WFJ1_9BACT|nr:helix-turn-helix domain-containing protein [Spirosoma utsteinense]MBC3789412.1 transposase-like protein [Spirosoma utsteinense]MBC3795318.1 transposase-like protein [Spirosoma utsteinense]